YQEEKDRFLADPTFNPQFNYSKKFSNEELVSKGLPSADYLKLAQQVLQTSLTKFTPEEFEQRRGPVLNQATVTKAIEDFIAAHHLENKISLVWSADFISRASVTDENLVKLRLPCLVREQDLMGLIYHELGTHVLRRLNYYQQPWYKKKRKFGFAPYLTTEEGLASIHSLFPQSDPIAYLAAINYLTVQQAQSSSFLEVWHFVRQFVLDEERAFAMTFKKKRGLTDTSQPGGFTKDLVYFQGLAKMTRFLINNDFPIRELYFGKLSWKDIGRVVELNPNFEPLLPTFYTQNPAEYERRVRLIGETNFFI
ncbi:MAG: tyrosine/phenylalanine carboxypeptidase domain-containing protein, partial [Candidatus Paceibacterota bacterium]